MTKPKCSTGTACGESCINGKFECRSIVYYDQLADIASSKQSNQATAWSASFANSPEQVRQLVARLPMPDDISKQARPNDAYSQNFGIAIGSTYKPGDLLADAVWRHEYGHYIDKRLAQEQANELAGQAFETLTGGSTLADVKYLADKYSTSVSHQLRKLAQDRDLSYEQLADLYLDNVKLKAFDGQDTKYVSTTWPIQTAFRLDEESLLAKQRAEGFGTQAKRLAIGPSLVESKIQDFADQQTGLPGELVKAARAVNEQIDSQFMLAALSESPERIAKLADRLLGSGVLVQDLAGALTDNRVGSGHTDQYYATGLPYRQRNTEAFANLFALIADGRPLATAVAQYLAPEGYRVVLSLLA